MCYCADYLNEYSIEWNNGKICLLYSSMIIHFRLPRPSDYPVFKLRGPYYIIYLFIFYLYYRQCENLNKLRWIIGAQVMIVSKNFSFC